MKMASFKFSVLLIIFVVNQASIALVDADLIDDTCRLTDFPNVCTTILRSDPASGSADIKELANIALQKTLAKANSTLAQVKTLIKQTIDISVTPILKVCAGLYGAAIDADIPDALRSLDSDSYEDARTNADAVVKDAKGCEEAFVDGQRPSPLTESDNAVAQLARIAQQIIGILG